MSLPEKNPWPGLLPYGEADAALFRGRSAEIEALAELVQSETLSVLYGVSGLGKTSLLRAGLFPRLRAVACLPILIRLDWYDFDFDSVAEMYGESCKDIDPMLVATAMMDTLNAASQGTELIVQIMDHCYSATGQPRPGGYSALSLWEYFHDPASRLWSAGSHPITPILVFDQFEEIFTLGRKNSARASRADTLLSQLADLLANRPPRHVLAALERGDKVSFDPRPVPLRVLFSLREDFLPHLSQLRERGFPTIRRRELRIEPLRPAAARRVIEQPAPEIVAPGLGDALLDFLGGQSAGAPASKEATLSTSIEPALLSVVLHELFEKARGAGQEQLTAELLTGSRDAILDEFYERAFHEIDPPVRVFVERELLTLGGFRDNRAVEDAASRPGVTAAALDKLVDRRLLRYEERAQGHRRVELTHDLLCGVVKKKRIAREAAEAEAARADEEKRRRAEAERAEATARAEAKKTRASLQLTILIFAVFLVLLAVVAVALLNAKAQEARAIAVRDGAVKLMWFMGVDLRDRLVRIGRPDLMRDVNQELASQYQSFSRADDPPEMRRLGSIIIGNSGDVLLAQGKPSDALAAYRKFQAGIKELVNQNPKNAWLQRDFSLSHQMIGDAFKHLGELDPALGAYDQSLVIIQKLVADEPQNVQWQRDLAICFERIGDIQREWGHWVKAAVVFAREIEIARPWLASSKADAQWTNTFVYGAGNQWELFRDAPESHVKIDRAAALADLRTARDMMQKLKDTSRFVPPMDKNLPWIEGLLREAEKQK